MGRDKTIENTNILAETIVDLYNAGESISYLSRLYHLSNKEIDDAIAFFLKPPKGYRYWDKVELIVKDWPRMVKIIKMNQVLYSYFITPGKIDKG